MCPPMAFAIGGPIAEGSADWYSDLETKVSDEFADECSSLRQ